ncbi:hypothetical protein MNBD_GAMMA02-1202 [hydrothermal vent metagenome]|uniref:Uncharacterized protein n=1 Tax=hydrothermal vent metagenome TaxID=652676 RepID=A0A3B0W590_9ZZZZ
MKVITCHINRRVNNIGNAAGELLALSHQTVGVFG